MRNFNRVKCTLLFLCTISVAVIRCDGFTQQNTTKTVGLEDPNVDANVKAALENGSVSEVVVRKDLLLFPVNAPDLVLAHSQEIHAVPQTNGSNTTDGKPVAAQVAEVNEYSLSQVVNDTDNNDTTTQRIAVPASALSDDSKNDSVLEPGKLLEIVSGFNLSNGMVTEKAPLPHEVQNFSLPKNSVADLLSKSLSPTNASLTDSSSTEESNYYLNKRSVDYNDDDDDDNDENCDSESTDEGDDSESDDTELEKRSVDSDENSSDIESTESSTMKSGKSSTIKAIKRSIDFGDDMEGISSVTEISSSSTTNSSMSIDIKKRSLYSDEDESKPDSVEESTLKTTTSTDSTKSKRSAEDVDNDDDDNSSNSTEYYDHAD